MKRDLIWPTYSNSEKLSATWSLSFKASAGLLAQTFHSIKEIFPFKNSLPKEISNETKTIIDTLTPNIESVSLAYKLMTDLVKVNQPLTMVYDLKLLNETDDEQKLNQFLGVLISFTLLNPR